MSSPAALRAAGLSLFDISSVRAYNESRLEINLKNMEKKLKHYQTAVWVLSVALLILAMLFINAKRREAASGVKEAQAVLKNCSSQISKWRSENPNILDAGKDAQEALLNILQNCASGTGEAQSAVSSEVSTEEVKP